MPTPKRATVYFDPGIHRALRVKAADSLNLILRAHVNLLESQQPSRFATILNRALYGLAGVGVGYLLPKR
jgi:hypothetical protein